MEKNDDDKHDPALFPKGQIVFPNDNENMAKEEMKRRGQYPLHDEEIGGA